jgi:hypothetical protein
MPRRDRTQRDKPGQGRDTQQSDTASGDNSAVYLERDLQALILSPTTPPVAKASAIRTLAEMQGLLGRHQQAPDRGQDTPVEELDRAGLVAELSRLREACRKA